MKKIYSLFVTMLFSVVAFAYDAEINGIYYNLNDKNKTAEVTYQYFLSSGNYSSLTSVTIPSKIKYNEVEYSVISIGSFAFYCSSLTSLTIPNSVTLIGNQAFSGCSLEEIRFNIDDLEEYVNSGINKLCYNIGSNIIRKLYKDNEEVTEIVIPNTINNIPEYTFYNCQSLTLIEIPNSVTLIGNSAFESCSSLTSITIPNSVTEIGNYSFRGCPLKEVRFNIDDLEKYINNKINKLCYNIGSNITRKLYKDNAEVTEIVIPNTINNIPEYTFYNCQFLTSIEIPNSVTKIENYAFYNCTSLTSITIPNSVTLIENYAFYNCTSLTSITIPNSVTSIGNQAFSGCPLKEIRFNIDDLEEYVNSGINKLCYNTGSRITRKLYKDNAEVTEIVIPNTINNIPEYTFYNCRSLTSIEIPNSVTSIGNKAFSGCPLKEIRFNIDDLEEYVNSGINKLCYNIGSNITRKLYKDNAEVTEIVIPNTINNIPEYTFYNCRSLTSITMESATPPTLGDYSIGYQTAIYIPDGAKSAYQNAWGTNYSYINNETSLTIHVEKPGTLFDLIFDADQRPAFVVKLIVTGTLNDDDFTCIRENMTSLAVLDISKITNTSGVNFKGKNTLTTIILPKNLTSIGYDAFNGCTSISSIEIPNSVTSIGADAFNGCTSISSIEIPNSVTSIGAGAFNGCTSISSIEIPNSVTSIGADAFKSCLSLKSITIPNSVTSIVKGTFYGCSSLTSVTIGNSVTSIGFDAFNGCLSLKSITIPNSVTSIGHWAFAYCSSFTSIEIPNSVTSIGHAAFKSCSSLTSITIPNSVASIGDDVFRECPLEEIRFNIDDLEEYVNSGINKLCYNIGSNIKLYKDNAEVTEIVIPNTINNIPEYTFYNCRSLTSIEIPNSVTSIGEYAFAYCSSLNSITIPNSVTLIERAAFDHCLSLSSITIGNSVKSIEVGVFSDCSSLTSITWNATQCEEVYFYYNGTYYKDGETYNYEYDITDQITSFTFGDNVECIPSKLCSRMNKLNSITIPNSVTTIGKLAFSDCSSLSSITCLGTTPPEANNLGANTSTCTLIVPKVAYKDYLKHNYWGQFLNVEKIDVDYKKITVVANNTNWGTINGSGYYNNGELAIITATANLNYHFVKWNDNVTENPRTIVVTQDSVFTAIFELNTFTITTSVNNETMGSVTGGGKYSYATDVILVASPNKGYHFVKWSDGNTENPRTIIVTEDVNLTAEFAINQYNVVVESDENGSVIGSGTYDYGTEVTIEAIANEGYHFVEWSDGNTENPRTIVVTEDVALTAEFAINQYDVNVAADGNGIITGSGTYDYGTEVTIEAIADEGYRFVKWSDGNTENPRTIVVTEDVELMAEFAINQYEVEVKSDENGTVTGSGTYDYGTEVTIEAIANDGYHFVEWSDGNSENPRTIVVTEDVELTAEFELDGTPVDNVDESSVIVYVQDGVIYVEGIDADYNVFDVNGRLVYTGCDAQLQLPRGVYMIAVGGEVEKVVL